MTHNPDDLRRAEALIRTFNRWAKSEFSPFRVAIDKSLADEMARAIRASDEAAGMVMVPRVATEDMLDAAMKKEGLEYPKGHPFYVSARAEFSETFFAMIAAHEGNDGE